MLLHRVLCLQASGVFSTRGVLAGAQRGGRGSLNVSLHRSSSLKLGHYWEISRFSCLFINIFLIMIFSLLKHRVGLSMIQKTFYLLLNTGFGSLFTDMNCPCSTSHFLSLMPATSHHFPLCPLPLHPGEPSLACPQRHLAAPRPCSLSRVPSALLDGLLPFCL